MQFFVLFDDGAGCKVFQKKSILIANIFSLVSYYTYLNVSKLVIHYLELM